MGACLLCSTLPLLSGFHSLRIFALGAAGQSEAEQFAELRLPWTQPMFLSMVQALDEVLPADVDLLCTPVGGDDESGKSRWFLFLADALYPRRVFVRESALASGTLMDYPKWIEHHLEVLDTDESGLGLGAALRRDKVKAEVDADLAARHIEWELRYRLDPRQPFAGVKLLHKGKSVDLRGAGRRP